VRRQLLRNPSWAAHHHLRFSICRIVSSATADHDQDGRCRQARRDGRLREGRVVDEDARRSTATAARKSAPEGVSLLSTTCRGSPRSEGPGGSRGCSRRNLRQVGRARIARRIELHCGVEKT